MARRIAPPPEWDRDARMIAADSGGDLLHFLSNSLFPGTTLDSAAIHRYTVSQASSQYSGAPASLCQLARTDASGGGDRGHGLSICPDGTYIVATTERVGDPAGNPTESFYVIPPDLTGELTSGQVRRITAETLFTTSPPVGAQGARFTALFNDGTVLLGCGNFARVPLPELLDSGSDLTVYQAQRWWTDGGHGELIDSCAFDCVVDPRFPDCVWFEGSDRTWRLNFDAAAGLLRSDKMLRGSNIGDPNDGGWPGGLAFGPDNYLWKTRSHTSDVVAFSPSQQDTAPAAISLPNGNPTPARTLTSTAMSALDTNVEGLHRIDFDSSGGAWLSSVRWSDTTATTAWHFSAAAMAQGGEQIPDRVITNLMHRPMSLRIDRRHRLYAR